MTSFILEAFLVGISTGVSLGLIFANIVKGQPCLKQDAYTAESPLIAKPPKTSLAVQNVKILH